MRAPALASSAATSAAARAARHHQGMKLLLPFAASLVMMSCAPELERCNSDGECGVHACVLGACVAAASADRAGRADAPDVVPDVPAGATDVDDADDTPGGVDDGAPGADCEVRTAFVDADGDGFTAGAATVCAGATLPDGFLEAARAPPMHVVEPVGVEVIDGLWTVGSAGLTLVAGTTGTLRLSRFACAGLPPTTVTGIEVHLRLVTFGAATVTVSAAVEGGTEVREQTVVADGVTAVLGSDNDLFGAFVDPATLCDGSFAIILTVTSADGAAIEVQPSVLVHGPGDDCDDNDPDRFSAALLRDDADGDGFAAGEARGACVGLSLPADKRLRDRDCDDLDVEAFPDQPLRFGRPRAAGGFDFNCNTVEERDVESVRHITSCFRNNRGACRQNHTFVTPSCGTAFRYADRCTNACNRHFIDLFQTCR